MARQYDPLQTIGVQDIISYDSDILSACEPGCL